jgi:lipopolysaccharide transport system permease protein
MAFHDIHFDEIKLALTGARPRTESPSVHIEPSRGWVAVGLRELWVYRELLYFLVWRDVKVRYKQTFIGIGWAILQPLVTMLIFTVVFGNFVGIPSGGVPYSVLTLAALLPWNYFSQALGRSGTSLVSNAGLICKVYFPRLIVPIAAAVAPLVDLAVAFIILVAMMFWFGITPGPAIAALPFFVLFAVMTALAVGIWLAALNVRYRDVGHVIPFLVQVWMFASPVVYPVTVVPEQWRLLYSINPMAGVIEGFRWALLGTATPEYGTLAVSGAMVIALLVSGVAFFKRVERTFADLI